VQQWECFSYGRSRSRFRNSDFFVVLSITVINKEITSNTLCRVSAVLQDWATPPQLMEGWQLLGKLLRPQRNPSACLL